MVAKIKKVVKDIADDPMKFANNLLKGLAEGFGQFFDNFGTHLLKGFLAWLFGGLKDVQIRQGRVAEEHHHVLPAADGHHLAEHPQDPRQARSARRTSR